MHPSRSKNYLGETDSVDPRTKKVEAIKQRAEELVSFFVIAFLLMYLFSHCVVFAFRGGF